MSMQIMTAPNFLKSFAETGNPLYFVVILMFAIAWIYIDSKKDKAKQLEALNKREAEQRKELNARDKEQRAHTKELMQHLGATVDALQENTNVMRDMQDTQSQIVDSIQHLNADMNDMKVELAKLQTQQSRNQAN